MVDSKTIPDFEITIFYVPETESWGAVIYYPGSMKRNRSILSSHPDKGIVIRKVIDYLKEQLHESSRS